MSGHKRQVLADNERLRELLANARAALATARKEERERCRKLALSMEDKDNYDVAAAIRAMEDDTNG